MNRLFDLAALVAVTATMLAVTRKNAVHALLYAVVSLLAVAFILALLGAAFAAALEAIVYAGAIMVLFLFVAMVLGLGTDAARRESAILAPDIWVGPALLGAVLLVALGVGIVRGAPRASALGGGATKDLALALFGPYLVATEVVSLLLLAGLVGAVHVTRGMIAGRRTRLPGPSVPTEVEASWK